MNTKEKVLDLAAQWKGQREKVVDVYNAHKPLARGYKVKYEDSLCATYVSALFIYLGLTDIVPPECGAMQLARNMQAIGRYTEGNSRTPEPGDLLFFDWGGDGWIDHVGIVTAVKGSSITYSHIPDYSVKTATTSVGSRYIKGYGRPDYKAVDTSSAADAAPSPQGEGIIRVGDFVTVKAGAKWYGGGSIKAFVFDRRWQVISLRGERAVLGTDEEGKYNIQSPIHVEDLVKVDGTPGAASPTNNAEGAVVTVTLTLPKTVYDRYGSADAIREALGA